ncbi:ATP-binding domain-containing protein [Mesorhizobium sp. M0664]
MRFHTHFTTPVEAKGLEFDVVVIPNLASYDGSDAVGRNSLYVAVSRPRL